MPRLRSIGRYTVDDHTIGKGNFAVVELATHTVTKTKVALKVMERRKITKAYVRKNLTREARVMSQLRHPNIVRLYETIVSPTLYCLVMEYVTGGDLLNFVRGQHGGRLKEAVARKFVRQLVSALHHMHERGIVHRDVKMENIILDKTQANVKIIDFGLSNQSGPDELFKTHCGTPKYAAPELFLAGRDYGPEVDIWSLGVNIYAMVTGKLPFSTPHSENRRLHLLQQIRLGLNDSHNRDMEQLTDDCKDLLHGCIEPIPDSRLPLFDIENHAWITCEGQELFCPYQLPPTDLYLRGQVIEEMALRLKVGPDKIQDVVKEDGLDDVSAIFNMMLDEHLAQRGVWGGDHTRPTVENESPPSTIATRNACPHSGRRCSCNLPSTMQPQSAGEENGVITPTVVSMVRPSQRYSRGKTPKIVDFELDVVDRDELVEFDGESKQFSLPPPWSIKNRPLGNATTANNIKARSYKKSTPAPALTSNDYDHECDYAHTDLLDGSVIHILIPTPSFESPSTSQNNIVESDLIDESKSKPRKRFKRKRNTNLRATRPVPGGSGKTNAQKPVSNVRVTYPDRSPTKARVVVPVPSQPDSSSSGGALTNGRYYHGYRTKQTQITNINDEPDERSGQRPTTEVQACSKSKGVCLDVCRRECLLGSHSEKSPQVGRGGGTACKEQSVGTPTPTPANSQLYAQRHHSAFVSKKSGRRSVDSSITASSNTVLSPRPILHPAIAYVHGEKESAAILSQIATVRCSDGGDLRKKLKGHKSSKTKGSESKRKGDGGKGVPETGGRRTCRRTAMELSTNGVQGQKFPMSSCIPQRTHYNRYVRVNTHCSDISTRALSANQSRSKFIGKSCANRSSDVAKYGHRYCHVPSFGFASEQYKRLSPSHHLAHRLQSPAPKSAGQARWVVDISGQVINSLVDEAERKKRTEKDQCGDVSKAIAQCHAPEPTWAQRRSPAGEKDSRFIRRYGRPTPKPDEPIRPRSSPAPRAPSSPPKETVFNIVHSIPHGYHPQSTPLHLKANATNQKGKGVTNVGVPVTTRVHDWQIDGRKDWDATYRLERKISGTVKGAETYSNKLLLSEQRTRAWVAEIAREFADKKNSGKK